MTSILLLSDDSVLIRCLEDVFPSTLISQSLKIQDAKVLQDIRLIILDEPKANSIESIHLTYPEAVLMALIKSGSFLETQHIPVKFLEKPFRIWDLQSFVELPFEQDVLLIGEFKLYFKQRLMIHPNKEKTCYLTEKEVDILTFLYHHPYQIFFKEELLKKIWNYASDMTTHTLETHIYRLRQKLTSSLLVYQEGGYGLWL